MIIICSISSCSRHTESSESNSTNIEKMDSSLLGITLKSAIEKLDIDTSQFYAFDEPPLILRGIIIDFSDSFDLELFVERTSVMDKPHLGLRQQYKYIEDKKIIGVSWIDKKTNKRKSIQL